MHKLKYCLSLISLIAVSNFQLEVFNKKNIIAVDDIDRY